MTMREQLTMLLGISFVQASDSFEDGLYVHAYLFAIAGLGALLLYFVYREPKEKPSRNQIFAEGFVAGFSAGMQESSSVQHRRIYDRSTN